ncbi:dolichyl-diphosphooligosaccharide--protein glycosyltransferase subunit 1-like [Gigantopelta aegis]|uniref:dolichyl-diphosphooligosaccharide--protein glycosyltransferase subunit 1-like n=1 Tax=Gigantopelta aegis TaxID=1735272 RepID=UPI001B888B33|nr:dolichyl-diphosphooligosaccharide--protein glycosyltransferase subunit 1-like [Gigantopelta aegis]
MEKQFLYLFLWTVFVSVLCKVNEETINSNLVNSKVERKIDISTHLVKIFTTVTIENKGASSVKSVLFVTEPTLINKLSFIGAVSKEERLTVSEAAVSGHKDKQFWKIALPLALAAGKSISIDVETIYAHVLTAHPIQITQAEKQLVLFEANLYLYSPYKTVSQTTTVTTSSSNIESYTKTKPYSQSDNTISYGAYTDQPPFAQSDLRVHEENNNAFLTVTSIERIIEVSHWGNVAVEEHIEMRHSGAVLKGPFSRFDYQRSQDGVSSIKTFKTVLPASARDVYYRDEIGNISTSNLRELDDFVELELRPRFPLFGGWKTNYYVGYNVPSYEYLYNKGDKYALKMRLVDHLYDDMVVDELTVRVILPEGSKNIELKTPYPIKRDKDKLHYTYLDTMGRPVIIMYKNNLVEQHIQDFELHYSFPKLLLLQEPLLVVGAFYLLFILVIVYVRLDFSITKDELKESRMRISSLIEEVQSTQDKRSALYQSYDDAINKFKANKDASQLLSSRKKIDADYKQLTQQIQNLHAQLKLETSDAAEKVSELQRLDSSYKEQINLGISLAERLVHNKIGKQQYLESDKSVSGKKEEIYQKMETLTAHL